jgi:hypothetical protein
MIGAPLSAQRRVGRTIKWPAPVVSVRCGSMIESARHTRHHERATIGRLSSCLGTWRTSAGRVPAPPCRSGMRFRPSGCSGLNSRVKPTFRTPRGRMRALHAFGGRHSKRLITGWARRSPRPRSVSYGPATYEQASGLLCRLYASTHHVRWTKPKLRFLSPNSSRHRLASEGWSVVVGTRPTSGCNGRGAARMEARR